MSKRTKTNDYKTAVNSKTVFYSDKMLNIPCTKLCWLRGPKRTKGHTWPMFIMRRDVRYSQIFWRVYRRTPGAPDKLFLLLHALAVQKAKESNV